MTIVQSGPEGWEFQYTATALIGLLRLSEPGLKLFVEPARGEDAELALHTKTGDAKVEIQAKSSRSSVGSSDLARFLAHFPEGEAANNLLARLLQDKSRIALFVVGGRCDDSIKGFLTETGVTLVHETLPATRRHLRELISKFSEVYESAGDSQLRKERLAFCRRVKTDYQGRNEVIADALRRVLIWEELRKEELEQEIESILSRSYLVPPSQARNARLEIVEAVRIARKERANVIPKLRDIVHRHAGPSLLFEPHLPRGVEVSLLEELRSRRLILLTGQSMCGKSHVARYLAQELQNQGVECQIGDSVQEAGRFLRSVGKDDRLFLLEDPFGHVSLGPTAPDDLSRLRDLAACLPAHRFLIVTSRSDIISLLGGMVPIKGAQWHDLTARDPTFLTEFWEKSCAGKGLSAPAFKTVLKGLPSMSRSELLQPGQLRHLAAIEEPVREEDFGALCSLAKCNSADLATTFRCRGYDSQRLHAALALSATTIQPVSVQCLNYVLFGGQSRPGVRQREQYEALLLGDESPPPPFPDYPSLPSMNGRFREELSALEQRGFIRIANKEVTFTHPDYYEASTIVSLGFNSIDFDDLVEMVSRAVACLYPPTAKSALRQLIRMHQGYTAPEQRSKIQELTFFAFDSIFPSVRDLAITTLVSWLEQMDKKDQERVLQLVRRMYSRYEEVIWHDGIPWLNPKPRTGVGQLFGIGIETLNDAQVSLAIDRLLDPLKKDPLSLHETWKLAESLSLKPAPTRLVPALKVIMESEEAFIRAEAAFLLMTSLSEHDEVAIDISLTDEHPAVVIKAIRGCFAAWPWFPEKAKPIALTKIREALENSAVAVYANRFLMDFGDCERLCESEREKIPEKHITAEWGLWAEAVPVFLKTVSHHSIRISEMHLWYTAREASKYLSPESGLGVCQGWLGWIEAELGRSLPDDYGFALSEFLIEVTRSVPEVRARMSAHLLAHPDTAFLLSSVKGYLSYWNDLTTEECALVRALCRSDRADAPWIRALALTRRNPPAEIVREITGVDRVSALSVSELRALLPTGLLQDCLEVYTGRHPLLYFLGFHHSADDPWQRALEHSAERPDDPCFELALRQMLSTHLNGPSEWPNAPRIWAKLCGSADVALRERLFLELLRWTIQINGNQSSILWRVFLNRIKDEKELEGYMQRIVDSIEAIESSTDELGGTFGSERLRSKILEKLPGDWLVFQSLVAVQRVPSEAAVHGSMVSLLDAIYQKAAPRMRRNHESVLHYAREHGASHEFLARVEAARRRTIEIAADQRKLFDEKYPDAPNRWRGSRQTG